MISEFDQIIHQLSLLLMGLAVLGCLLIGGLFFLKKSGQRWANRCFGAMLILAGFTQLHYCLDYGGFLQNWPELGYYPIYFNLWLPVLLFFYIKLTLYPGYLLHWSDLKHFALPLGQLLYFWLMWLIPAWRHPDGRWFYSPFYGGLEQALFLFMVPVYLVFGYQYFRRSRRNQSTNTLSRTHWYLFQLMRGTFLFWLAYAVIALVDFFAYKFWDKDMREMAWFAAFGAMSFGGLLYGWCLYGFQVLVWGRNLRIGRRLNK